MSDKSIILKNCCKKLQRLSFYGFVISFSKEKRQAQVVAMLIGEAIKFDCLDDAEIIIRQQLALMVSGCTSIKYQKNMGLTSALTY
ncbi:hypothetical protein AAEX28_13860 [Lentisphaerota bacterium WC36G]|nr:hypothetical protein LJT99_00610 [Lentisphaerae bacterium WC36]